MNSKFTLGIDPGLQGGIGVINQAGELVSLVAMPVIKGAKGSKTQYNEAHLAEVLCSLDGEIHRIQMAYVERVHSMSGQGVSSSFRFGTGFGIILGELAALKIPYALVTPQRWQKTFFKDLPGKDPKQKGQLFVSQRFPEMKIKKSLIDAFLIAYWGYREMKKEYHAGL